MKNLSLSLSLLLSLFQFRSNWDFVSNKTWYQSLVREKTLHRRWWKLRRLLPRQSLLWWLSTILSRFFLITIIFLFGESRFWQPLEAINCKISFLIPYRSRGNTYRHKTINKENQPCICWLGETRPVFSFMASFCHDWVSSLKNGKMWNLVSGLVYSWTLLCFSSSF